VAISECIYPNRGIILIYGSEIKVTRIRLENLGTKLWKSVAFSNDSSTIAAIGKGNKEELRIFIWKLEKQIQLGDIIPISSDIAFIPYDPQDSNICSSFRTKLLLLF
jgi:hypothetical protein